MLLASMVDTVLGIRSNKGKTRVDDVLLPVLGVLRHGEHRAIPGGGRIKVLKELVGTLSTLEPVGKVTAPLLDLVLTCQRFSAVNYGPTDWPIGVPPMVHAV